MLFILISTLTCFKDQFHSLHQVVSLWTTQTTSSLLPSHLTYHCQIIVSQEKSPHQFVVQQDYLFDIPHNNFSGLIPACLLESLVDLRVLNARENRFEGNIPEKVSSRCALQTINLHGNKLEGLVPSSWANCADLEVLDLGRNKLADSFPYWLMNLPALKVLVLKENRFFGHLTGICEGNHFMMLLIFDISSNRFTGSFSSDCFKSMKAMMVHQGPTETIGYKNDSLVTSSYRDIITVNLKGLEIELVKILTTVTSIDLSNNRFVGNIP
ncbi:L domain-like protein [Dioscorea alata]|uniref:L domain-like protein n=1 Tax=Dioscorea alata TaxID=55571 RepID=A0ACB7VU91_DIOAL|nr:L domain-like protein [Dioscorea alata]